MTHLKREKRVIPSYIPAEPNDLPFFLEKRALQKQMKKLFMSLPAKVLLFS